MNWASRGRQSSRWEAVRAGTGKESEAVAEVMGRRRFEAAAEEEAGMKWCTFLKGTCFSSSHFHPCCSCLLDDTLVKPVAQNCSNQIYI